MVTISKPVTVTLIGEAGELGEQVSRDDPGLDVRTGPRSSGGGPPPRALPAGPAHEIRRATQAGSRR